MQKCTKQHSVGFCLESNITHATYSSDEYDRHVIDSILYLKCMNRVPEKEWHAVFQELNEFKLTEMVTHKDSLHNIKMH